MFPIKLTIFKTSVKRVKYYAFLALVSLSFGILPINIKLAEATIPKYINFQGKLTAVSGGTNAANGTYAFEFKIYDALTSGSLLWTETFDQPSGSCGKLTVTNGVFNAKLGSCASLASVDFTTGALYLSVNFAPTGTSYDGEMSPRKQLVSSAFAFVANSVSGDGPINTINSSATALTVAKAGSNYGLQVDTSASSAATGLKVTSAAAASGVALAAISSGTNENITLDAKGSGTVSIGASSTGDILLGGGSGSTGCTVTNASGAFACTAGGSFTTLALTGALTGATSYNGLVITANTGVVTTGTWNAGVISPVYGGTGVSNNAASTLTISGNFATTLTVSATTSVTLPTSGTLYGTATGSFTSANLLGSLSDETGTGSAVFGTSPRLTTSILDTNGNTLFGLTATGSAVNYLQFANAAAGNNPSWTATGSSTDIGITHSLKGAGKAVFNTTVGTDDAISIAPFVGGAGQFTGTITTADLTGSDKTYTFPNASGTVCISGGSCTASALRWDQLQSPTAALSLTMPATNETTFTVQSTTQTGFLTQSSTLTSGVLAKYLLSGSSAVATPASSGSALTIASTTTGYTAATQTVAAVNSSGANSNSGVTVQGFTSTVTNTNGTSGTNIAGVFSASGATTANYAIIVPASGGNVGIGDTTPTAALTVGSGDLFQVNSSGAIAAATGITSSGTITLSGLGGGGTQCLQTSNTGVISGSGSACGSGSGSRLDQITAATADDTDNDNTNKQISWAWSTAATENPFTMTANALTTGKLLSLTSTNTGLTSGSLLNVSSATTGTVATNGIVSLNATGNYASTSGAGLLSVLANSTTAGTVAKFSGTSLTTGTVVSIIGGTSATTGTDLEVNGATYVHTGTETGSLAKFSFTDSSSNATGTATTNGILIQPTINTTASAGTKIINGASVSPTLTACGTTAGTCTFNGYDVTTPARTQTTTNTFNMRGLNLGTAGALVQNTAAGTLNWTGLNVQMPNITQTTGTVTAYGLNIAGGTMTSGVATGINISNSINNSGATAVAGILGTYTMANSTASGFEFGNRFVSTISSTTAGTHVGDFIRMTDNTTLDSGQVVRGLEVQAYSGTNNNGTNTGIASFGKTFGVQGTTTAQAAAQAQPAAIFADLDNGTDSTTKARGNAIRAYTNDATSADLVSFYQETSAYTGNGLIMNFGNNSGSFSGNFLDLQVAGSSKTTITSAGRIGILDSSPDYSIEISSPTSSDSSFALSDGDVTHGLTALGETDAYMLMRPISSTAGGLKLEAFSDTDASALNMYGYMGSTDPTDTTPAIKFIGAKKSTTDVQDLAAAETIFQVANNDNSAALSILGDNKVGIGVAAPTYDLDVQKSQNTFTISRVYNNNGGSSASARFVLGNDTAAAAGQMILSSSTETTFGGANSLNLYNGTNAPIAFFTNGINQRFSITGAGNVVMGNAAISTSATDGFFYMITSAGAPVGTPTAITGRVAMEYDTTNNKLCAYNAAWKCSGAFADVAEWAPAAGTESGDVVAITNKPNPTEDPSAPFMLGKADTAYNSGIIGVISKYAEDAHMANGYPLSSDYHALTLAGRVPVKISNENGNIYPGDFLTASATKPGFAMKATRAGTVIGQALQSFDGSCQNSQPESNQEQNCMIMVFINVGYHAPSVSELLQNPQDNSDDQLLNALVDLNMTDAAVFGDIVVSGNLYVQEDLQVKGSIIAATMEAETITAKQKLCVGNTCVTEEQLQSVLQLLSGQNSSNTPKTQHINSAVESTSQETAPNPTTEESNTTPNTPTD